MFPVLYIGAVMSVILTLSLVVSSVAVSWVTVYVL